MSELSNFKSQAKKSLVHSIFCAWDLKLLSSLTISFPNPTKKSYHKSNFKAPIAKILIIYGIK